MPAAMSVRERAMRNPATLASMYRLSQSDPSFRRFMGRALNSTIPCTEWKPYQKKDNQS